MKQSSLICLQPVFMCRCKTHEETCLWNVYFFGHMVIIWWCRLLSNKISKSWIH